MLQPQAYLPISSGWLSQFANAPEVMYERAQLVDWALFGSMHSLTDFKKTCDEVSMYCVDTDRPSWNMPVEKYNQYNRRRLIYGKPEFEPVTMTFYDTLDSSLLKLLLFQLSFISDSYLKSFNHFAASRDYSVLENFLNNPGNWGSNLFSNTSIFEAVSLVEMFGNSVTVYNLQGAKITRVSLSKADASSSGVHKISVTFEYEGLTNINPDTLEAGTYDFMLAWAMTNDKTAAKLASMVRMRYQNSGQLWANIAKDFFLSGNSFTTNLRNLGAQQGFGDQIKFADELRNATTNGPGSWTKQITNPSSVTSKSLRLF